MIAPDQTIIQNNRSKVRDVKEKEEKEWRGDGVTGLTGVMEKKKEEKEEKEEKKGGEEKKKKNMMLV